MKIRITCLVFTILVLLSLAPITVIAKVPDIVLKQQVSVVTIYINSADHKETVTGSGFIIDSNGVIVTNHHVISKWLEDWTSTMLIKMENGAFLTVENVLAYDEINDIALIKAKAKNLPTIKLSQTYKPKQGEDIYTIGSPQGLEKSVSSGIISNISEKDALIQITAPISPGSSGSPVLNTRGDVIGVATSGIEGGQSLNFAIHYRCIKNLLDEYKQRKPLAGLWKTDGGTLVKAKTEEDKILAYLADPSSASARNGYYEKNQLMFEGEQRGLKIQGTFIARYPSDLSHCYPEGRPFDMTGDLVSNARIIRLEVEDILIDSKCKDMARKKAILMLTHIN